MILETLCVGELQVNCYIIALDTNSRAIIIDPGSQAQKIKQALNKYKLKPALIVNTHGHIDHIGSDNEFNVPVYIHRKDALLLNDPQLNLSIFLASSFSLNSDIHRLEDKENIELEGILLEVIHVPGHTPGGIALLMKRPRDNILFTGDSLFCGSIGRTDFPGADGELLIKSIKEKLLTLPDNVIIYPGHGSSSTIGEEKKNNPFLS